MVSTQRSQDPAPASYIGSALRKRENQLAAGITLVVAVLVALFMQRPLPPGTVIELAEPEGFGLARDFTPVNFWWKAVSTGRWTQGPEAQVLLNRPLPERGHLLIEAFGIGDYRGVPIEVRAGPSRQKMAFGEHPSRMRMPFANEGDVYVIEISLPPIPESPGDDLHAFGLSRITVEAAR